MSGKIQPGKGFVDFLKQDTERSISERFEEIVERRGHALAISSGDDQLDYQSLNRRANQLAHALLDRFPDYDGPIAVLLRQGISSIATVLGVLKAGKFYLPLDPTLPDARNALILDDSAAGVVLTDSRYMGCARAIARGNQRIFNVDECDPAGPAENAALVISPDAIAHVLYTSGSTGHPKGVIHSHRNVLHNVMRHTNAFRIAQDDRQTLLYPNNVYGGTRDIFNALLNGACLCQFRVRDEGVAGLGAWLIKEEITLYCSVATIFRHFVDCLDETQRFPALRLIKLGGEATHKNDIDRFRVYMSPDCVVHCGLGATETGVVRHFFVDRNTEIPGATVPLGYPVQDMEVLLIDKEGHRAAPGEVGEIAVKSRYIARGYWRSPELTEAAFRSHGKSGEERIYLTGDLGLMRPDGCLLHRGRTNFQVKIQGNRIDLSEVESAMLALPAVNETAVVVRKSAQGEDRLVAYWTASEGGTTDDTDFHGVLAATLPRYAIPSALVLLDSLPLTPNGKIDRKELQRAGPVETYPEDFVEPCTPVEKEVAAIYADVLKLDCVGVYDNFFTLGGQSLLATQVLSQIHSKFGVELPMNTFFKTPDVSALALNIIDMMAADAGNRDLINMLGQPD